MNPVDDDIKGLAHIIAAEFARHIIYPVNGDKFIERLSQALMSERQVVKDLQKRIKQLEVLHAKSGLIACYESVKKENEALKKEVEDLKRDVKYVKPYILNDVSKESVQAVDEFIKHHHNPIVRNKNKELDALSLMAEQMVDALQYVMGNTSDYEHAGKIAEEILTHYREWKTK